MPAAKTSSVLYRYFFFGWLFRDAGQGSITERRAAWRHNLIQARWLPTYLRRWLALGALSFSGGVGALAAGGVWPGAAFFVLFSSALPVISVIIVAMLGFRFLPSP